jgi:acetolactate synthase-1/2/3 large subunit
MDVTTTEQITGSEAIVRILEKAGVKYAFGLCGHANLSLLDALYDSDIEFISVRNEGMAVHMADAYFRASHQIAAVVTTVGPGVTNTVTAVADAMADASAVLIISGDVPSYLFGKGALQEISTTTLGEQWALLRPVTKGAWRVADAGDVPGSIHRALNLALSGCPGPVSVSVPMDLLSAVRSFEVDEPQQHRAAYSRMRGDREAIERATDVLAQAERPMILSGNGVLLSQATPELIVVAEHLAAPVATSLGGQGSFPKSHRLNIECPNSIGNPAVRHAMLTSDAVLVVGSRLTEFEANSWDPESGLDPRARQDLVQIDVDPDMIGRELPVRVGIVGDAKAVLAELAHALYLRCPTRWPEKSGWLDEVLTLMDEWRETVAVQEKSDSVPLNPYRITAELRRVLQPDSMVHVDAGSSMRYIAGQQLRLDEPGAFFFNAGFGSMGATMASVLGAKLAQPQKQVVAIVGDGGFTCNMSPVITAVEHGIPVVWIVINNYAFHSIEIYQHRHFDGRVYGTTFRDREGEPFNPDFASLARTCGALGFQVRRPEELAPAIRQAIESNHPSVVEVIAGQTRYVSTHGWFEANRILGAEAEFKRQRSIEKAAAAEPLSLAAH